MEDTSDFTDTGIKEELTAAVKYAEGRGIRIAIHNASLIPEILKLVDIKLKY